MQRSLREAVSGAAAPTQVFSRPMLDDDDDDFIPGIASEQQHSAPAVVQRTRRNARRHSEPPHPPSLVVALGSAPADVLVPQLLYSSQSLAPGLHTSAPQQHQELSGQNGHTAAAAANAHAASFAASTTPSTPVASSPAPPAAGHTWQPGGPLPSLPPSSSFATAAAAAATLRSSGNGTHRGHRDPPHLLMQQLTECSSWVSLERFMRQHWTQLPGEHFGAAAWRLSQLVEQQQPATPLERTAAAALAGDLAARLRGEVARLSRSELSVALSGLARLRACDAQLLRAVGERLVEEEAVRASAGAGAAAAAQAGERRERLRHVAGFLWAYGRFRRDFRFEVQPAALDALVAELQRLTAAAEDDPALPPHHHHHYTPQQQLQPSQTLPQLQLQPQHALAGCGGTLAAALYGLALLARPPSPELVAPLLAATRAALPGCGGRELSMLAWALATLRVDPGAEWVSAFLAQCDVSSRSFGRGSMIANVMWALATLGHRPPAGWMVHMLWQARRRFNTFDGPGLAMLAWALGRMRFRPDRNWSFKFVRYAGMRLFRSAAPSAAAPGSGGSGSSGNGNGSSLPAGQQQQLQPAAAAAVARFPPQVYNNLLWGFVRLSISPSGPWLVNACRAMQPQLGGLPPNELSNLLWALSRLSFLPSDDWLFDYCCAVRAALPAFQPGDAVLALRSFGRLAGRKRCRVDPDLLDALAAIAQPHLARMRPTTLIGLLHGMVFFRPPLPAVRYAALLHAIHAAAVHRQPGGGSASGAAEFTPRNCANAAHAAGLAVRLASTSAQRHQAVQRLGSQLLDELAGQAEGHMAAGRFNAVDLAVLIQGLAAARHPCAAHWLRLHEAALRARMAAAAASSGSGGGGGSAAVPAAAAGAGVVGVEQLVHVHRAYRALGHMPLLLPRPPAEAWEAVLGAGRSGQRRPPPQEEQRQPPQHQQPPPAAGADSGIAPAAAAALAVPSSGRPQRPWATAGRRPQPGGRQPHPPHDPSQPPAPEQGNEFVMLRS